MNRILGFTNFLPFANKYYSGMATVFMLHRVHPIDSSKLPPNERMKVSPEFLEKLIKELKSGGFDIISLDKLDEILRKGIDVKNKIVFTLDDGYKDNYEIAYPIFKKYNAPFTIYVTTSMPERKALLWWYILEDLILSNNEILLADNTLYRCRSKREKINTFFKIRELIISFEPKGFERRLKGLFSNYEVDWDLKCKELSMSWDEIKFLADDPLVTIGGHTKNHYTLNRLQEEEVKREILEGNKLLEDKLNKKISHFAYPFGSQFEIGQREFDVVRGMFFKTSTTTRHGNIYKSHKNYLECLPRIMLTENFAIRSIGNMRKKRVVTL